MGLTIAFGWLVPESIQIWWVFARLDHIGLLGLVNFVDVVLAAMVLCEHGILDVLFVADLWEVNFDACLSRHNLFYFNKSVVTLYFKYLILWRSNKFKSQLFYELWIICTVFDDFKNFKLFPDIEFEN